MECVATQVHWSPGAVTVEVQSPLGAFSARRLIVALPLGVLQAGTVRFDPRLPDKQDALRGLEMGHVVKVVMAFRERFWQSVVPDELGFLVSAEQPFRAWWTGYPVYAPIVVAWAGGPVADALGNLTLEQRADRALESLAHTLNVPRGRVDDQVRTWATHDWSADPFARGAYSYVLVGGMSAQAALAQPVADTLFFAGEATELDGHQATVHGALYAGERAAGEVLRSLNL
jgi:monoamine oxidase